MRSRIASQGFLPLAILTFCVLHSCPALAVDEKAVEAAKIQLQERAAADPLSNKAYIPTKSLLEIMDKGGILMWPIAFCSLLAVAFFLERLIGLRRSRIIPRAFVKRLLSQVREGQLDRDQALELCEASGSPVSQVFAGAIRKWGRPAVEVEQAIIDAGERTSNDLRRYLRVFNAIHTVAPLLGLLGTVFGMIQAFNRVAVSDALGRPELLADGISEALLTTAAGLTVAIPALIMYLYFLSRADRMIIQIDDLAQELVGLISAEALEDRPAEARVVRGRRVSRTGAADSSNEESASRKSETGRRAAEGGKRKSEGGAE
jgi:biopolymer transport protein ExbB